MDEAVEFEGGGEEGEGLVEGVCLEQPARRTSPNHPAGSHHVLDLRFAL
jgi:hypothetical protein